MISRFLNILKIEKKMIKGTNNIAKLKKIELMS